MNIVSVPDYRTSFGVATISGLHILPIALYTFETSILTDLGVPVLFQYTAIVLLGMGRALCMSVEVGCQSLF